MTTPPPRPPTPEELRAARQPTSRILVTVVGVVLVWFGTRGVYQQIAGYLGRSLYTPACAEACAAVRATSADHRLGGRGNRGQVHCWCNGPARSDWQWRRADLSKGSVGDLALHWGGQETLAALFFTVGSALVLFLAGKITRKEPGA
jgi:hypothetical protein